MDWIDDEEDWEMDWTQVSDRYWATDDEDGWETIKDDDDDGRWRLLFVGTRVDGPDVTFATAESAIAFAEYMQAVTE